MVAPEPFTSPDLDLRDFPYMPLDVVRLRDSEAVVVSSAEEFRAAVILWCAAWHQVPAASLPDDDRLLASMAGFGRDVDSWTAVRPGALRGFIVCSDGRLYHPVIAEKANEASNKRRSQRRRTAAATAARRKPTRNTHNKRDDNTHEERNVQRDDTRNVVQGKGREGKRTEGKVRVTVANATDAEWAFDEFKKDYPKRDGSNPWQPAKKAFEVAVRRGVGVRILLAGARAYRAECERKQIIKTDKVAQALTWLRQERWLDYTENIEADEARLAALDADMKARGFIWKDEKWVKGEGINGICEAGHVPREV